jgi:hypothetical protein
MGYTLGFLVAGALVATVQAQSVTVTKQSGGGVQTRLLGDITLNQGSSLTREWITLHDSTAPADLEGTMGIETAYVPDRGYTYRAKFAIQVREPLTAIQVRFLLFDIWGNHIGTLASTEVVDLDVGTSKAFTPSWNLFSENEASEYYASVAYLARVRTKAGRVVQAPSGPVLDEARKFAAKFTAEDLEPKPAKKQ